MKVRTKSKQVISVSLILLLFIGLGFFLYSSTGRDDCYITYNAALNFSKTGHILNINHEKIEQGTSLLHVVLLGGLHRMIPVDMVTLGFIFSIVCGVGTIIMIYLIAGILISRFKAFYSALYLAIFGYFVYWSFGGLECTLVALCYMFFIYTFFRLERSTYRPVAYGLLFLSVLLLILVRPEMVFILCLALFFHGVMLGISGKGRNIKVLMSKYVPLAVVACLFFALVLIFRYHYFNRLFPLPVYAKASGISIRRISKGLVYMVNHGYIISLICMTGLIVYYFIYLSVTRRLNEKFSFVFSLFIANIAFICMTGGDWMEGGRFLIPVIPMIILLFFMALEKYNHISAMRYIVMIMTVLILIDTLLFTIQNSTGIPAPFQDSVVKRYYLPEKNDREYSFFEKSNKVRLRDMQVIAKINELIDQISEVKDEPVTIITAQMGMIPYYVSKTQGRDVRFYDRCGLTTTDFYHDKQKNVHGTLGVSYMDMFNVLEDNNGGTAPDIDILYDLGLFFELECLDELGYKVVYLQLGHISARYAKRFPIREFVAVRKDHFEKLALSPEYYDWTGKGVVPIMNTPMVRKYTPLKRVDVGLL